MADIETLADRFEAHRERLRAVAHRMLGSTGEADDAVQEAWLRLSRGEETGGGAVENLGAWLTTVVARVCLDMLRARKSRKEEALDAGSSSAGAMPDSGPQPDAELRFADSIGLALLVVLDTLAPAERIAFVLHDLFDVPFDEIAPVVGRSSEATRQLASRARRRVQGATPASASDHARRRQIVSAFLAASRDGDFEGLLATLDPDVVLRADRAAVDAAGARAAAGAPLLSPEVRGARAVAEAFRGRARAARMALIDGAPGAVWAPGGVTQTVFAFTLAGGPSATDRIVAVDVIKDPAHIAALAVVLLDLEPKRYHPDPLVARRDPQS